MLAVKLLMEPCAWPTRESERASERELVMRFVSVAFVLSIAAAAPVVAQTTPNADDGLSNQTGLFHEPRVMSSSVTMANRWLGDSAGEPRDGFYADFGNMITGAGWISAGPGYRRHLFGRRAFVDASAALSWRAYKMAQARFELPGLARDRLTVGSQVRWQDLTQVNYFGIGSASSDAARSQYRLKDTDVVGYGVYQANRWLAIGGTFGWLRRPTLSSPTGPFQGNWPDTAQAFPLDPGVASQPSFLHGTAGVTVDTRDYPGHPTRGGLYRAGFAVYSDRDGGAFSFRRYDTEGLQMVPVKGDTWVLALHGWAGFSDTSSSAAVPFYMLPSLGGQDTLRGYTDYRFHDRNFLQASAESRWALFRSIDAVLFFDAGNVAPRVGDLNMNKTSWGTGLRVHAKRSTLARLDVGHSTEGWRVFFKLDDPFGLKRLSRRTADAPFVP